MAMPEVDNLHQTLMQFAERTNDLVCSANSKLECLVNNHSPEMIAAVVADDQEDRSSLMEIISLGGRASKRARMYRSLPLGSTMSSSSDDVVHEGLPKTAATLRPVLPVEILDTIFYLLKHQQLRPVLLANSFLYEVARRKFYHTVVIKSPRQMVSFLKKVLSNPELPPLVRSLELSIAISIRKYEADDGNSSPSSNTSCGGGPMSGAPLLTSNFYLLLNRGLRAMHSLLSLSMELPKSHSPVWIFNGAIFKLRQFTTSMHCHRPLAWFLEKQDMIEDLTLRGFQSESLFFLPFLGATAAALVTLGAHPGFTINNDDNDTGGDSTSNPTSPLAFTLSPTALPRLRSFNAIHAGPSIIHTVMQGRSVETASIPLFPDCSISTLNALGSGQTPLKRLSVISFDPGAPEFLFEELARRFKDLEALHLVLLMADYTRGLFEDSGRILANFTSLKYITFMAASTDESSIDEDQIANEWHRVCPTLRTIILPKGRVWFQGESDHDMQIVEQASSVSSSDED